MRIVKLVLVLLLAGMMFYFGYYAYSLYKFANQIQEPTEEGIDVYKPPVPIKKNDRINILILGVDSRSASENMVGRSDSMMVASIDPVSKRIQLFSILRDTYVEIPGHGKQKINSAYAYGRSLLSMQTTSQFMDIPIHYYVTTDFEGFIELVDILGGVEINVEKDMEKKASPNDPKYEIHLKKGLQVLDGEKALQYVRFRGDIESDYGRAQRQRKFLTAVADKMQQSSSILKIPKILNAMEPYINTNMEINTMIRLASIGFKVDISQIPSIQLPPKNLVNPQTIDGAWVITFDEEQCKEYIAQILEGKIDVEGNPISK